MNPTQTTSPRPRPTSPQTAGATSEIDLAPAPHIFDWGEVELAPTAHHKNHHDLAPGARSPQTDLTTPGATPMTTLLLALASILNSIGLIAISHALRHHTRAHTRAHTKTIKVRLIADHTQVDEAIKRARRG